MGSPEVKAGVEGSAASPSDPTTQPEQPKRTGRVVTQVVACVSASFGNLASGTIIGWTAATLPSLDQDPHIQMGTSQNATMVGISSLLAILGSLLAGRAMDRLGRRSTIMCVAPVTIAGWVVMALAPYTAIILVGRAICGLTMGFLLTTVPVYNSEVPEARVRGRLGTMSSLFLTLGMLLSYVAGAFLPWRYSCYVCAVPSALSLVTMFVVPESPYWLMLKTKKSEAEAALRWLRGPHYDLADDLQNIEAKIKSVGRKREYRELLRPRTRKPFFIALFIMTTQQLSGASILMMYTGNIFISAGVENHHLATVYTGLIQVVGTVFSMLMMDHVGRRPLIVASTLTMGVCTSMLGVYYYMDTVVGVTWPAWVALATVLVSVLGYCLGCRTIPWLSASELFNTTIRSTANTVCIFYNRILNFSVLQIYPFFVEGAGAHTVFFFFGAVCLLCSFCAVIILPETKGKTLEQIQEYFEKATKSIPSAEDDSLPSVVEKEEEEDKDKEDGLLKPSTELDLLADSRAEPNDTTTTVAWSDELRQRPNTQDEMSKL